MPDEESEGEYISDQTKTSPSEQAFCVYVQKRAEKIHPPRTNMFNEIHVTDVLGCLHRAALSRTREQFRSCFSNIAMREGTQWEEELRDFLLSDSYKNKKYKYVKSGFFRVARTPLKPIEVNGDEFQVPHTLPTSFKVSRGKHSEPLSLIGTPDYYDADKKVMAEMKRTRYSQEYVKLICSAKEENYNSVNAYWKDEFKHVTRHLSYSCDYWPNYFFQMAAYSTMLEAKKFELRVIFNDAPKFWDLTESIENHASEVNEQFINRLTVLRKYLGDPSKYKFLYDYESATRWDETFCRDCPFLSPGKFAPCPGLAPFKRTYLRKRDVEMIKGLASLYHRDIPAFPKELYESIQKMKMPGDKDEKDKVVKVGTQSKDQMILLSVAQAQFALNRLKFAKLSTKEMEAD